MSEDVVSQVLLPFVAMSENSNAVMQGVSLPCWVQCLDIQKLGMTTQLFNGPPVQSIKGILKLKLQKEIHQTLTALASHQHC